jgi:hypothetical protein
MSVWVNVWRSATKATLGIPLFAVVLSVSGCIDDFDDPIGYGGAGGGGRSGSTRRGCFEVCERTASCAGADELSCKRDCAEIEAEAEAAGCSEEWAQVIECALELDSLCADTGACDAALGSFTRCSS